MFEGFEFELSRSREVDNSNQDTDTPAEVEVDATSNHVDESFGVVWEETGIGMTTAVEETVAGVSDTVVALTTEVAEDVEVYQPEIPALLSLGEGSLEDPPARVVPEAAVVE